MTTADTTFRLKGWHVLTGFVSAFAVIISVNVFMATSAVRTFPGLEVKNSYVASQEFDRRRTQQEALGWTVLADWTGGMVHLSITDADGPVRVKDLHAVVGRATQVADDVEPVFAFNGQTYEAPLDLGIITNLSEDHLERHGTVDSYHAAKLELQRVSEHRIRRIGIAPHALRLGIGFGQGDGLGGARRGLEIGDGFGVDGEETAGRAVFGRHVGDGRPVG